MSATAAEQANQGLVDRLIAEGALWSPLLIAAFRATPRHQFLDRVFQYQRKYQRWREVLTREPGEEELRLVYSDRALITHLSRDSASIPISSSSQPSLMAQMLEDLLLAPRLRTLEVGAGTGYNAALLAHVVGPGRVLSMDVDRNVLSEAWDHLRAFAERQVRLQHGDGRSGFAEAAPYDRIMVTAATPEVEPAWLEQLAPHGLLLAPLVLAPGLAYVVRGSVTHGVFHGRLTRAAYFMPLRIEGEAGESNTEVLPTEGLQALAAPWAGWFDRKRPRTTWLGFIQALAFFGLVRGLAVYFQTLGSEDDAVFGVSDGRCACWLGAHTWQISGGAGRDLGWNLWRAFLDAGGPRPTEYRLWASPSGRLPARRGTTFVRQGRRLPQLWELLDKRDRPTWI